MSKNQTTYDENEVFKMTFQSRHREHALAKQADALGFDLIPKTA